MPPSTAKQIMLSGHLHRHIKQEPQAGNHQFPVLVNSNNNLIKADADNDELQITVFDQEGAVVDSIVIRPGQ